MACWLALNRDPFVTNDIPIFADSSYCQAQSSRLDASHNCSSIHPMANNCECDPREPARPASQRASVQACRGVIRRAANGERALAAALEDKAGERWLDSRGDVPMTETIRILIIDDEPEMRRGLRRCFEGAGYAVCEAANATEARTKLSERIYNLVTVDYYLFGRDGHTKEDGAELAREIHQSYDCGLIMISKIVDRSVHNDWLRVWADATIAKPFNVDDLLAATSAVLRRRGGVTQHNGLSGDRTAGIATFAGWQLDEKGHKLTSPQGNEVILTPGEYNLLRHLLSMPHVVLSREEIIDKDPSFQTGSAKDRARAVDMRVYRLRHKLGDEPDEETAVRKLILTVRSFGYKLNVDVGWSEADVRPVALAR